MTLDQRIEAILFAAAKPFSAKKLSELLDVPASDITSAMEILRKRLESSASGVMLQHQGNEFEIVTHPDVADDVKKVIREEEQGELTRPALEALTILSYRGPLTRPELEQIRGVYSSIILRNLQLRGLVEQNGERLGQPLYAVTFDFLRHLGVAGVEALPEYEALRGNQTISDVLAELTETKVGENEKLDV